MMKAVLRKALAARKVCTKNTLSTDRHWSPPLRSQVSDDFSVFPVAPILVEPDISKVCVGVKTASQRRIQNRRSSRVTLSQVGMPKSAKQKKWLASNLSGRSMEVAKRFFRKDLIRQSSVAAQQSRIRTLEDFARDSNDVPFPLLPMTEHSVTCIAARLKEGGYQSAHRYLGAYKALHEETMGEKHVLSRSFNVFFRRALRSLMMASGTTRRAATYDLHAVTRRVANKPSLTTAEAVVPGGPWAPATAMVSATTFALREMESSSSALGHVAINYELREVTFSFLGTKSNPGALEEVVQGCAEPGSSTPCDLWLLVCLLSFR